VILKDNDKLYVQIIRFLYFAVQMEMVSEVVISRNPWHEVLYQVTFPELSSHPIEMQLSTTTGSDRHGGAGIPGDTVGHGIVDVVRMPGDTHATRTDHRLQSSAAGRLSSNSARPRSAALAYRWLS
jgi:hypothetical protein